MLADQPAEYVGRPSAAWRRRALVEVHRFENPQVDLRSMPARQAGGHRDAVELLKPGQAAVEVKAVNGAKLQRANRIVHTLTVINVRKRNVKHDGNAGKSFQLR